MIGSGRARAAALCLTGAQGALAAERPAVCALVQSARNDALVQVPFEVVDGRIYVQAKVDGAGPFRFVVDTGASGMGRADASLVRQLGLPVAGEGESSDGVATAKVEMTHFAALELGGLVRRDLKVIMRDYGSRLAPEAKFAGIIGRDFFGDGLLVIDYPARLLTFGRGPGLLRGAAGVLGYDARSACQ